MNELDRLVSVHVMGWSGRDVGFTPSISESDALLLVDHLDKQVTITKCKDGWLVAIDEYYCHGGVEVEAETMPLAVCLAALKWVGVETPA